jgi:hypothetical protein
LRARPKEDCKGSPLAGKIYIPVYVKAEFDEAIMTGRPAVLHQELMPRINSAEERLVPESNMAKHSRDIFMDILYD